MSWRLGRGITGCAVLAYTIVVGQAPSAWADSNAGCGDANGACMTDHTGPEGLDDATKVDPVTQKVIPCKNYSISRTRAYLTQFYDAEEAKASSELHTKEIRDQFVAYLESKKNQVKTTITPASSITTSGGTTTQKTILANAKGNDDCAGSMQLIAAKAEIENGTNMGAYYKAVQMDQVMAKFTYDPSPLPTHATFVFPDPHMPFQAAPQLKDPFTTQPMAGTSDADKLHHWMAENLEKQVRTFLGGSKQLTVDKGPLSIGTNGTEVHGYYEGYEPNLIVSGLTDVIYYNLPTTSQPCGVANVLNGDSQQIFKSSDQQFHSDRVDYGAKLVYNWRPECQAGGWPKALSDVRVPMLFGQPVVMGWILMQAMQKNLLQGKLVPADAYPAVLDPEGVTYEGKSKIYRSQIIAKNQNLMAGFAAANPGSPLIPVPCAGVDAASNSGTDPSASVQQIAGCAIAAMQLNSEVNLVSQYVFYVWHQVWSQYRDILTNAVIQSRAEPIRRTTPTLKPETNGYLSWLESSPLARAAGAPGK